MMKIRDYLLFPTSYITALILIAICAVIFRKNNGYWASFDYLMDLIDKVAYEAKYKV